MRKYAVLYHSGVGNTRFVAERIACLFREYGEVKLHSVEDKQALIAAKEADGLIVGFPVYHGEASFSMRKFIEEYEDTMRKPCFIFATFGLYRANSLRKFAITCDKQGVDVVYSTGYRMPATDGVLLMPTIKWLQSCEKNIEEKLVKDCLKAKEAFEKPVFVRKWPRITLHGILNTPNALLGKRAKFSIYLQKESCVQCEKCVRDCPRQCWKMDEANVLQIDMSNCEHCYRCIHKCPQYALSLRKRKKPKVLLNDLFYQNLQSGE